MLRIAGVQKLSLIDYPGRPACVIFTQGCNFRCGYCHNPQLVLPEAYGPCIPPAEVLQFLQKRQGVLEGVVITGGEPTLQKGLPDFLRTIKALSFKIKLDTNGSRPKVLKDLLAAGLLDFVAMDIKAPFEKYEQVTGCPVNIEELKESVFVIVHSGVEYLLRTTLIQGIHTREDVSALARLTGGLPRHILQNFVRAEKLIDERYSAARQFAKNDFLDLLAVYTRDSQRVLGPP